jgi:hypothetical protein
MKAPSSLLFGGEHTTCARAEHTGAAILIVIVGIKTGQNMYIYICVYIYISIPITFTYFEFLMPPWFSGSCATDWLDLVSFCFLHTYLDLLRFFLVLSLSKVLPVLPGVIVSQVNRKRMLTSSPHRFQRCCRSLQVWLPPTSGRTWCCFSSVEAVEASLLTFCVGNSAAFGC